MSRLLSRCRRLSKSIDKYEAKIIWFQTTIKTLRKWIKRDKASIKISIQCLPRKEYLEFGYKEGFINEADYQTMRMEADLKSEKKKK